MKDPEEIDLSTAYEQDHPPPKRGRPASTFPSGLTVQELADQMPCCSTLVGKWCLGLRITPYKKQRFFDLAGFGNDQVWQQWLKNRNSTTPSDSRKTKPQP